VQFIIIYSLEAHPTATADPATYDERVSLATTCGQEEAINVTILVDEMDNAVWWGFHRQLS
jgi:hypothetical protein